MHQAAIQEDVYRLQYWMERIPTCDKIVDPLTACKHPRAEASGKCNVSAGRNWVASI